MHELVRKESAVKKLIENARRRKDEQGATVIEYVLIVALVSIAIAVALGTITPKVSSAVSKIGESMNKF